MNSLQTVFLGICLFGLSSVLLDLLDDDTSLIAGSVYIGSSIVVALAGFYYVWDGLGQIAI